MKPALPSQGIKQSLIVIILCLSSAFLLAKPNRPGLTGPIGKDHPYSLHQLIPLHSFGFFNSPPVAGDDIDSVSENHILEGNFFNNDTDPDGDSLSMGGVIIDPTGPHLWVHTVLTTMGGFVTFFADGFYTYSPPANYAGSDQVVYTICDVTPAPLCSSATITFTVIPGYRVSLPVNLEQFTGKRSAGDNLLQWITAQENNSHHFELQNSTDNSNFSTIASITAKGNSSLPQQYSYVHHHASTAAVNYYRLKLVDKDGRAVYSKIVAIKSDGTGVALNTVYPNPFRDKIEMVLTTDRAETIGILIYDVNGRLCVSKKAQTIKGLNVITIRELGNLQSGMYVMKVTGTIVMMEEKLFKAK